MSNKTIEQRIEEAYLEWLYPPKMRVLEINELIKVENYKKRHDYETFVLGVKFGRELERERSHQLNIALGEIAKKAFKAYEDGSGK